MTETTFETAVLDISYSHKIKPGLMKRVTATKIAVNRLQENCKRPKYFFFFVGRFLFIQVLEVWIFGTVMVFHLRHVSVMSRLRLRQFSLSVAYFSNLHRCGSHFCFILITWNFLSSYYFIGYAKFVGLNFLYNAAYDNKYFVTLKKETSQPVLRTCYFVFHGSDSLIW